MKHLFHLSSISADSWFLCMCAGMAIINMCMLGEDRIVNYAFLWVTQARHTARGTIPPLGGLRPVCSIKDWKIGKEGWSDGVLMGWAEIFL